MMTVHAVTISERTEQGNYIRAAPEDPGSQLWG